MADKFFITLKCRKCFGTKVCPPAIGGNPNGSCDLCGGSGETSWDFVDLSDLLDQLGDLSDRVDDVLDKCNDILEAIGP